MIVLLLYRLWSFIENPKSKVNSVQIASTAARSLPSKKHLALLHAPVLAIMYGLAMAYGVSVTKVLPRYQ